MKKILFVYCLLFTAFCFSQSTNPQIDSLLTLLKKDKEDTNKVIHLNKLSREYIIIGIYDSTIYYGNQAIALCDKILNPKSVILNLRASAYNTIGVVYRQQGDYPKGLDYFFKALKMYEELGNKNGIAISYGNIGILYWYQEDFQKTLDYYFKALKIGEELGDKVRIAIQLGNIGLVYSNQGDYPKALDYYFKALKLDEELGNKQLQINALGNIAIVYNDQASKLEQSKNADSIAYREELYNKALDYYFKALKIAEELGDKKGVAVNLGNIGSLYIDTKKYKEAEKYLSDALKLDKELGDLNDEMQFEELLSDLYTKTNHYQLALEHYKKSMALKDTLFSQEKDKEITRKEMNYEFEKKEAAAKAEQDKKDAVAEAENRKQKIIRNSIAGGLCGVLLFSLIVYRQRNRIAKEKKRSDELLLNILPAETAEELKLTGHAEPKQFDMVTVLFTDFKDFTQIAEKMNAKELVGELNFLFSKFDEIIAKYPIEKIKTIGDAYMCAGGLPTANNTNAKDIVNAAIEIQRWMSELKTNDSRLKTWELRIGVHTGPIVAGIVGIKKFAYDIWGDTVNTASRMESSGEAGKVNISGSTYEIVKDKFTCTYRGKVQAKNKGEIEMYFVEKEV